LVSLEHFFLVSLCPFLGFPVSFFLFLVSLPTTANAGMVYRGLQVPLHASYVAHPTLTFKEQFSVRANVMCLNDSCHRVPTQSQVVNNNNKISTKLQDVTSLTTLLTTLHTPINQCSILYKQPVYTADEQCSTRQVLRMGAAFPFTRKCYR
jgi:hypothetical protein